jgi:hypothetical protein
MDPVSLIVAALAASASAALKDTAGEAVKDAYAGLKSLLKRKLGDKQAAQVAIDKHEEAPEVWEKPLESEIRESRVADDEEVVKAAQRVMKLTDPEGSQASKFNVVIFGCQCASNRSSFWRRLTFSCMAPPGVVADVADTTVMLTSPIVLHYLS